MSAAHEPRAVPRLPWPSAAELTMPGSKSVANRLLVAAALCGREVTLTGVTASDDVRHLLAGLRTLGFRVQLDEANERACVGPRGTGAPSRGELHCGNAGTALRFLVSVAAITPGDWTITGDAAMQRRPIGPLVDAWRQLGVAIEDTNGRPPVRVHGEPGVRGGVVSVDTSVSSQFTSSLLLVGAALPAGVQVVFRGPPTSAEYVELTVDVLRRVGVHATVDHGSATVRSGFAAPPATLRVDGDWSSFGVWACLDHLTGSDVTASNLPRPSCQADAGLAALLRTLPRDGDHTIDVATMPDQFCNLVIVAAHRTGATTFTGGANLRVKESDRIAVMARELGRLGADVEERPDGVVVRGGRPLRGGTVDPAADHRVAMAFALAGLLAPGIAVADPGCVTKSYPRFWDDVETVVRERAGVVVVGMRGAGKSTFARAFAARTGVRCVDTDAEFEREHGPIDAFVTAHGWPAFRAHEERLLAAALRPATVVGTGGGAIESATTRARLRGQPVVWLTADAPLLRARLGPATRRPSVTGAPVLDELPELLARREPLYAEVATVRVDAALPAERQVDLALQALGAACRWPGAPA